VERVAGPHGVRAVEVLTELFGGIPAEAAEEAARAASPGVRARVAWSLGRAPHEGHSAVLERLAADPDPLVATAALCALRERSRDIDAGLLARAAASNFAREDKGVRMAAARLASVLSPTAMRVFREKTALPVARAQMTEILASIWRGLDDASRARTVDDCLDIVSRVATHAERRDAVRLLVLALGDWHLDKPPLEIHSMCSLPDRFRPRGESASRIISGLGSRFPSGDGALDLELSRVLAMLEAPADDLPRLGDRVVARIGPATSVSDDIHYLIILSRLTGPLEAAAKDRIADALLSLARKAGGLDARPKQVWGERLEELLRALLAKHPDLGARLLAHPALVSPAHVGFAACLSGEEKREAAARFVEPALEREDWPWTEPLLDLLSALPGDRVRAAMRERWEDEVALRDAIAVRLATHPEAADRAIFLEGLGSASPKVVAACLGAIEALPPDGSAEGLAPLLRVRKRLLSEKGDAKLIARVEAALSRASGHEIRAAAGENPEMAHERALAALSKDRPELRDLFGTPAEDLEALRGVLARVPWSEGAASRGETLYRKRCEACHAFQGALGPSLAGAVSRFSRDDIFTAIADPARDVAPAFRPTVFRLHDGGVVSGVVVFESADGYIVQTDATRTVRLSISEVASVAPGEGSLMPAGLLKDLAPGDLADLYSFLEELR
jgi:putative heme-binding domain-containing protein